MRPDNCLTAGIRYSEVFVFMASTSANRLGSNVARETRTTAVAGSDSVMAVPSDSSERGIGRVHFGHGRGPYRRLFHKGNVYDRYTIRYHADSCVRRSGGVGPTVRVADM